MKRYVMLPAASALLLFSACVVPYPVEYSGTYEPTPPVVEVPALPPMVVLETRPYYGYGGYHYYWDANRDFWLYSRSNRGPWYQLPRSHYPERFQYKGEWHEGRGHGREHGMGGEHGR
jgi:hypothetical protein